MGVTHGRLNTAPDSTPVKASRRSWPWEKTRGLSSVYGFIMIYLLVIASLQAISISLSSSQGAEAAAQQAGQVAQMRSLEHLKVALSKGGNVTIANDGLITSSLSFLLLQNSSVSRQLPVQQTLAVGASVIVSTKVSTSFPSSVAVVTSLGNVFASSSAGSSSSGGNWKTLAGALAGPGVDAQIYQNPGDPTRFFLSSGPSAFAYSASKGTQLWSFNAGQGEVTDVLPLTDGGVYVSDGYYGDQFTSNLYRLTSSGTSCLDLLDEAAPALYTTSRSSSRQRPAPAPRSAPSPSRRATDGLYAYYDGWFFSSSGPSATTVPGDAFNLATSDANQFYLFTAGGSPGGYGCTNPRGNVVSFYAYSANSTRVSRTPGRRRSSSTCATFTPSRSSAQRPDSGVVASVFSVAYWSTANLLRRPIFRGRTRSSPSSPPPPGRSCQRKPRLDRLHERRDRRVARLPLHPLLAAGGGGFRLWRRRQGRSTTSGSPRSSLSGREGSLFAIADSQVKVYDSSMNLKKSIDFTPQSFYSLSNSKPLEPQMIQPSFLVLNSTSYVALLRNSTGYGSLVLGAYSP